MMQRKMMMLAINVNNKRQKTKDLQPNLQPNE